VSEQVITPPPARGASSPTPDDALGSAELELGTYVDAALQASGDRTKAAVEALNALDLLVPVIGDPAQPVGHGDALDDQGLVLEHNLADRLDVEVISPDLDVTRFQRAGKGARQSPTRSRDHVVKRGGARRELVGPDAVVLGDLGMHAEGHGLLLGG
jgi:hypothetical protein